MKKVLKVILGILGTLYLAVILFATVCLLCYNQYKVTQINDKTFIIIDDKSDMYTNGDLVIFTKNSNDEISVNDEVFFYEITNGEAKVNSGKVTKSEKITDTETTFTINGSHPISSETVIGKTATAKVYHNVGAVLYVFESQYGFLLLVILPALLLFFYAIYRVVKEIKTPDDEDETLEETKMEVKNTEPVKAETSAEIKPESNGEPVEQVSGVKTEQPAEVLTEVVKSEQSVEASNGAEPKPEISEKQDDIEYL